MKIQKKYGKWRIGRFLSKGGQSSIYEVTMEEGSQGKIHAIKIIKIGSSKKKARFIQEIKNHIKLSEQKAANIIPIIDHNLIEIEKGNKIGYLVMPKAKTNLEKQSKLLEGRIELCLEIFYKIVSGIREAHKIGIIHRDIKPANILFLDYSLKTPLITDFGICFIKETERDKRITEVNETVGAKFFMAPEQECSGITDITESADIYSLGKLLHYMITRRNLSRETLEIAFTKEELEEDPRYKVVLDDILYKTVIANPKDRIQSTDKLLETIDKLKDKFNIISHGKVKVTETTNISMSITVDSQNKIENSYHSAIIDFDDNKRQSIKLKFDNEFNKLKSWWDEKLKEFENKPEESKKFSQDIINSQSEIIGLTLAISKIDSIDLFKDYKNILENITRISEKQGGYKEIIGIPHAEAGFLYMLSIVASLYFKSWNILEALLRQKFEYYYQSGRPIYTLGIEHPYFFHTEALDRDAADIHDFYRNNFNNNEIKKLLGISNSEDILSIYLPAQMIMCLRGAQEIQLGNDVHVFADFGRFYERKMIALFDKVYHDQDYAKGICKSFNEEPIKWIEQLNERIKIIKSHFFGRHDFIWESIDTYEPRFK